jgi:hypothetical protein
MRALLGVSAALCVLVSCGGKESPAQLCQQLVNEVCKKLFQCDPTAAQQLGFTSQSDCDTKQAAQANCANAQAGCNFDQGAVNKCLSDFDAQACTATSEPASCALNVLCPGQVVCSGTSISSGGTGAGCTVTFNSCSDGHTYGATCSGTGTNQCTCQKDGVNGAAFTSGTDICSSSTTARPVVQADCGFAFQ